MTKDEPTIEVVRSLEEGYVEYQLRVPNLWFMQHKEPKLQLLLWLIRLVIIVECP